MILDPSSKLEAVLAGAVTANQPEVHVDYFDWNPQGEQTKPAPFRVALNSTTDVTILAAPQVGFIREVLRLSIYNKDTASVTVIIKTDDGTTERIICKATLLTLETLNFEKDRGWYVTTATGAVKSSNDGIPVTIFDAAGDIIYATAADTAARLAIGTARQVLTVNAGATAPGWSAPITLATEQATTSGTVKDFTGIPAGVKRITIMFVGVSTNGTSNLKLLIGDAGGLEETGYVSTAVTLENAGAVASSSVTTYFILSGALTAAGLISGTVVLTLENAAAFTWVSSGQIKRLTTGMSLSAGDKSLSAELTQLRITTTNGTDAFDAGAINISYE